VLIIESSIKPIEIFFHSDLDESQSCKEFLIDSVQSVVKNLIFLDDVNEIFKYFNLNENVKILIIEIDNYKLGVDYTNLLNIQNNIPTLLVVKQDDTESLNFLLSLGFHHFIIKDSNKDNLLSKINVMYIESKNKIELEKTERELSSLNEELEEKISIIENNREKIEDDIKERELFLANISHEIRTPLNAMMGFVELLKDTPLNEDQKSYIDTISYSSKNLTNILNDVLDYSKIESNNLRIENICINIKDELTEVLNLFQIEAQNKNLYLNLEIEENVPLNIKTDPTRVKQIISNLVNNAIKFTVSGGVSILVKTFSNLDGRFIEFYI
jgi:signal transduction histidine kinase